MNHQIAQKYSGATAGAVHKCKKCEKVFHGFYLLRERKQKEHAAQSDSAVQTVDVTRRMRHIDDDRLINDELET